MTAPQVFTAKAEAWAATLGFDDAQTILAAHALPLATEHVRLAKAGRRVLAEPVCARLDAPRHDAAAMDGFAVREEDFAAGLRRFRIAGCAYPGNPWNGILAPGEAVRIMTGAAMPVGAGRVIVREATMMDGGVVVIGADLSARTHVRPRASDIARGDQLLAAGRLLEPRALLVAAAADVESIVAWRRPRVHVIASGDELTAPGSAAADPQKLPDSLSQAVLLMARQWGGVPIGADLVADGAGALREAARAALDTCDVLVMSGGASKGDRDFARLGLEPLGLELAFADVAIKPGKPVWYGRIGDRHVLGLPGNPTAAMTIARLFLAPLLAALGGRGALAGLAWTPAPLLAPVPDAGPRESFLCAEWRDGGVRVIDRQSASAQFLLAGADALVRRPVHAPGLAAGCLVDLLRF